MDPLDVWPLDKDVIFLNHGSFGSCPQPVRDTQDAFRRRLEREPIDFLVRDLEPLLDHARETLAQFAGATPSNLVFVQNATSGINAVLRSLRFSPGDELLVTNQEYNACRNVINYVAEFWGAKVVVANVPFPIRSELQWIEAIEASLTHRTKIALFDHVTSQTALVAPVKEIIRLLRLHGVMSLVDGAHAPGMVPLELDQWQPDFYTGNCHKWICAPKGAAMLYVRPEFQHLIRPTVISHGANSPRQDRSRYLIEFAWTGTHDPSPYLSIPKALEFMGSLMDTGWSGLMNRNHRLAIAARDLITEKLGISAPAPDPMLGSMAALPLRDAPHGTCLQTPLYIDELQTKLRVLHRIEVPVIPWPAYPNRLLRVSAQAYNSIDQYQILADAVAGTM